MQEKRFKFVSMHYLICLSLDRSTQSLLAENDINAVAKPAEFTRLQSQC